MWKKSLKRRFSFTLVLPVLGVLALASMAGYFAASHEVDEIYDAQLANMAKTLMALMEHEAAEGDGEVEALEARFRDVSHEYEKYTALRIWHGDHLFFYTKSAEVFGAQHVIAGFSTKQIGANRWRFFVLPDPQLNFTVEIAEDYAVRQDLIQKIILTMFLPFILLLVLLPVFLWLGLKYGLRPLLHISEYVGRRSQDDLSPLSPDRSPAEILPIIHAINGLMKRISDALTSERHFTDLAAHELRTPLAVIKTQVQNLKNAASEKERAELLADLTAGVQRATEMVTQLLALARLGKDNMVSTRLSVNDIARSVAQEMLPLALDKQIQVEFIEQGQLDIRANAELLALAVRNLLANAIKYTPEGGCVFLLLEKEGGMQRLSIRDTGAGIPADKLSQVTDRFYRVPGNEQVGSGLGLAIVLRAAESMGAHFSIVNHEAGGIMAALAWKDNDEH